jgi:uncharacterized protein
MTALRPLRRAAAFPAALALVLALALAVLAQGLSFPALSGRIVDQAGLIDAPTRARLETVLAQHEAKTSDQVVVATVASLNGTSIEDYANQLFRHWKLGEAKTNNGVLLLVAPNERRVRIEVGYGLEGQLTDAISSMIIQAAITPKFRTGDFAGGIERGAEAIVSTLAGGTEWQDRVKLRAGGGDDELYDALFIFLVMMAIIIVLIIMSNSRRPPGGGMHRRRGGKWIATTSTGGGIFGGGWSGGGGGGWSDGGGGGFSGGGGSSGGGGASGSW